jgi:hypothetical protein
MVRKISRLAANKSSTKQKAGSTTNIKQSPSAHKQASNEAQGIQARTHQVTLIKEAAASTGEEARVPKRLVRSAAAQGLTLSSPPQLWSSARRQSPPWTPVGPALLPEKERSFN